MSDALAYDRVYLRSISGILKICCLLCCASGTICIVASEVRVRNARGLLFLATASFASCCTTFVLLARLFQLWQRKHYRFDVVTHEMHLYGFLALAFFVVSSVTLTLHVVAYSMAAFFGLLAFSFYAYDTLLAYRLTRKTDAATQTPAQTTTQMPYV